MQRASPASWLIPLLGACIMGSALGVIATTHHVREGYARLQVLELERWRLQEQYTRLLLEINTWAAPHRILKSTTRSPLARSHTFSTIGTQEMVRAGRAGGSRPTR